MLDHDLVQLAARVPEAPLIGLEQAIWSKVEVLNRFHRFEQHTSRIQVLALVVVLIASTTIGMAITRGRTPASSHVQILSEAAQLAPSALLGF